MKQVPLTLRRWTRSEYDRLVQLGVLDDELLEVYRDPGTDPTALYGSRYRRVERLGAGETVSPLALATVRLAVGDLLP